MSFTLIACQNSPLGNINQTSNGVTGTLSFSPDPPIEMKTADLTLQLIDQNEQPIEDAQVSFDFTMPAMKMPPNQPKAISQGDGLYTVQTGFSMSGDWQAEVTILQDSETTRLIFDFKVQ